jgi:hypothetical protein
MNGERVTAPSSAQSVSSDDADIARLFARLQGLRELNEVHAELVEQATAAQQAAEVGFAIDAAVRLPESILNRAGEPPLEILGDAYRHQSQAAPAWIGELRVRIAARNLANALAQQLREHLDKRLTSATQPPRESSFQIDFNLDQARLGCLRLRNRSGHSVSGCLIQVRVVPDPERAARLQAVEEFSVLPLLFGATLSSVVDRKQLNALLPQYFALEQLSSVFVPELQPGAVVDLSAADSRFALTLAKSVQVSVWPAGFSPLSKPVGGLSELQDRLAIEACGGAQQLIRRAKQVAESDPAEALRLLKRAKQATESDPPLETARKSVHDEIVKSLKARQAAVRKEIGEASADVQRLNSDVAAQPKNSGLRARYEAAKQKLQKLEDEASWLRTVLELR